jgi:hypothetical protein
MVRTVADTWGSAGCNDERRVSLAPEPSGAGKGVLAPFRGHDRLRRVSRGNEERERERRRETAGLGKGTASELRHLSKRGDFLCSSSLSKGGFV